MRIHTFRFNTNAQQSWVVDVDSQLIGFFTPTECIISFDPSLTNDAWQNPSANSQTDEIVLAPAASVGGQQVVGLNVQLIKGQKVFVAVKTTGVPSFVQLYLEDVLAEKG